VCTVHLGGAGPTQTEEPAAVDAGYLIEFRFAGDREYQDLEFFVASQFAATVIAGGETSAASYGVDKRTRVPTRFRPSRSSTTTWCWFRSDLWPARTREPAFAPLRYRGSIDFTILL
jgi:hypothetical protein